MYMCVRGINFSSLLEMFTLDFGMSGDVLFFFRHFIAQSERKQHITGVLLVDHWLFWKSNTPPLGLEKITT